MDYIKNYILYKKEHGEISSEQSVKNYKSKLQVFLTYIKEVQQTTVEQFGREDVVMFTKDLEKGNPLSEKDKEKLLDGKKIKKKSASTVLMYLTIIKNFTRYLNDVENINKNEKIQKIEVQRPADIRTEEVKWLTERQESAIFREVEGEAMYYAIFRLMRDLGLRIEEVLTLNLADYDAAGARIESRPITIHGKGKKGGKIRKLLLPKQTADAIREWEREREEKVSHLMKNTEKKLSRLPIAASKEEKDEKIKKINQKINDLKEALFISREGNRLTQRAVQKRLEIIKKRLKYTHDLNHLHPHMFRHTCLKKMAVNGASPSDIAKISGHSSLDMILRYTESTVSDSMKFLDAD